LGATAKEQGSPECLKQTFAKEEKSMQAYITKLEEAVKRKHGEHIKHDGLVDDQVAMLKAQIDSQDETARIEMGQLREYNEKLQKEREVLEVNIQAINNQSLALETQVSDLHNQLAVVTESRKMSELDDVTDTMVKKYKKLKKTTRESERRNLALTEERDSLLTRVGELGAETASAHDWKQTTKHRLAELVDKDQRIENLQEQVAKSEHGFRQRGEQLIQLSRDAKSKAKLKLEKNAAVEAKSVLQTRVSGMFYNYRSLLEKNDALFEKLTAMAKAGGFGHAGSLYHKELALLKGQPLEELNEYKNRL
jgi:hypothetical protein